MSFGQIFSFRRSHGQFESDCRRGWIWVSLTHTPALRCLLTTGSYRRITCIFILDSLGQRHPQTIRNLQHLMTIHNAMKKPDFVVKTALVFHATLTMSSELICCKQVPLQMNFYDCGLHAIHLSQKFSEDPDKFCQIILVGGPSSNQVN
jgi:hypothetical protein